MKLYKVEAKLKFKPKRNYKLITPCCNRQNKDGKFINYINHSDYFGYCHSCGKTNLPPTLYKNENGDEYLWNETLDKFESTTTTLRTPTTSFTYHQAEVPTIKKDSKYIPENVIWQYFHVDPENNLLFYLRKTYGNEKVDDMKETYCIGTDKCGGTVFWNINSDLKIQKAKISYYNENGKRSNRFKVPYKNDDGYYSCLFGEHLIIDDNKDRQSIVLVESEKTALVGYIFFPEFIWLAYGGCNGLTLDKMKPLIGWNVKIVPDMSENAVNIVYEKIPYLISIGIKASIWDMTEGKTDDELKTEGLYNNDLEDVFRKFSVLF